MYDYTGNNWRHRNGNKRFKEKFGSHAKKTFNRVTTAENHTQYGKYCSLKLEASSVGITAGSRGVPARKACGKGKHNNNNNNNNSIEFSECTLFINVQEYQNQCQL
jgi:hypothetical protein